VVQAADRRITALGTQFDVRIDPGALQVLLVSGRVRVDGGNGNRETQAETSVRLAPGQRLSVALGAPAVVTDADVAIATAWRRGLVAFDETPLAEAVAELNRYAAEPLIIRD